MELKKLGVIGVGHLGQHHARVYTELLGSQLVGVVDQNENRAAAIGDNLGVPWYTDIDEFIAKAKPDAVSVVVPTSLHFEIAEKALSNGIHVLIEKPVTPLSVKRRACSAWQRIQTLYCRWGTSNVSTVLFNTYQK